MSRSSRAIATIEHSGSGKEELSRRNEDQLYLALSSARTWGTWDWHLQDHTMHWDERMHALFGLPSTFGGRYEQFLERFKLRTGNK